jgi:hypothetical protein
MRDWICSYLAAIGLLMFLMDRIAAKYSIVPTSNPILYGVFFLGLIAIKPFCRDSE